MPGPVNCPSCGHTIAGADGVCAVCGFTVRRGAGAGAGASSDAAVDAPADAAVGRSGPAGWAPAAPSPPARITAPPPVAPPPSQISVDGLEARWSGRFPRRPVRAAAAAAGAVVAAASSRVPTRGSSAASSRGSSRRSSGPLTFPVSVGRAAARAGERQRELSGVSMVPAPAALVAPVGFDQVLGSNFLKDSAISGAGPRNPQPLSAATRRAPAAASAIALPSWWRGSSDAADASRGRPAPRNRAPLPRMGVVFGVMALLFVGLIVFTGYASHWSGGRVSGGGDGGTDYSQTVQIAAPQPSDLVTARRQLAGLAGIVASPSLRIADPQPVAARRAHALRVRLITWRDGFQLTGDQILVLDNAIAYAGALGRWLKAPQNATRQAAALNAWRIWRANDPLLRKT